MKNRSWLLEYFAGLGHLPEEARAIAQLWGYIEAARADGIEPPPEILAHFEELATKQHRRHAGPNARPVELVRWYGLAVGLVEALEAIGHPDPRGFVAAEMGLDRALLRKLVNAAEDEVLPESRRYRLSVRFVADRARDDLLHLLQTHQPHEALGRLLSRKRTDYPSEPDG